MAWPPRSPDLTSLDFYLWSEIKRLMYTVKSYNAIELKRRISEAFTTIIDTLRRLKNNLRSYANLCTKKDDGHFQHLQYY